ncbi:MAG TPA: aldose 1-epimerase family protein [Streptosporangiaceae bacterium]|nr:aldose 1-epimerase family protein [Streptosporangiaceae bacterium]
MTLTGNQYEIKAGPYNAVVTESGARLRELTCDGRPLVLGHDADETAPAAFGQVLTPWPNRIDHGRYDYDGATHQLPLSEPELGHAIHGLARWVPWTAEAHDVHRVRLGHRLLGQKGYPFRLDLAVEYALDAETGLTVSLSAHNTGSRNAPYGQGAHPYLTVGEPIDQCTVCIPADSYQPVDARMIPDGPPADVTGTVYDLRTARALGDQTIDNAFTGLRRDADGKAWVRLTGSDGTHGTVFWLDDAHPWLEIYTADAAPAAQRRLGLAVEPMTCPPNAFVSGTDVIDLKPGASFSASWGIMST